MPAIAAIIAVVAGVAIGDHHESGAAIALPTKTSKEDMTGRIFERPVTVERSRGGNTILDVTTPLSSDGKFASGMYRSGKSRFDIDEPYGVDEFMYFIEGGVTLTSADGSVPVITVGEATTLPREWIGVRDTEG